MRKLRLFVREVIREMYVHEDEEPERTKNEKLLGEPDFPPEIEECEHEASVAGIAGVTTPLGTGPTYPAGPKKKKKKLPRGWQKK
tara:strand:- start:337 stop:591 length:255 start_codon:yes stop_codon:yes gene_type:complete